MKQKFLQIPCILFLAITLIATSCSKGPAGATGPAGPAGPQGSAGAAGATGATGSANVIYSPWISVTFQQGGLDTNFIGQIHAAKLTDSILNKGEMKVYFNAGSDSAKSQFVLALPVNEPFLFTDSVNTIKLVINPYFSDTTITMISNYDVSSFADNGNHYFQFRYILVPGGTTALPASINGIKSGTINWNDYNQVKQYLGLKD